MPEKLVVAQVVEWLREFGLKKAILVVVLAALVLVKYVYAPWAASRVAATVAEGYGVALEVADWHADLWGLRVGADDLVVRSRGAFGRDELFSADKVELDLSLMRALRSFFEHLPGSLWRGVPAGGMLHEVVVRDGELYLERLSSGAWNFEQVGEAAEWLERRAQRPFELRRVRAEGLELEWVENLLGGSGAGLVQTTRASLLLDDVTIDLSNLRGPVDRRDAPTRFVLEARTGDGRISAQGHGNLFRFTAGPRQDTAGDGQTVLASLDAPARAAAAPGGALARWRPALRLDVALDNVGSGAFARMVPSSRLVPVGGSMTGTIKLLWNDDRFDCRTDLQLAGVSYVVNPAYGGVQPDLEHALRRMTVNDRVVLGCEEGGGAGRGGGGLVATLQTAVTSAAVRDAPAVVRATAAADERAVERALLRAAGADDPSQALADELAAAANREAQGAIERGARQAVRRVRGWFD